MSPIGAAPTMVKPPPATDASLRSSGAVPWLPTVTVACVDDPTKRWPKSRLGCTAPSTTSLTRASSPQLHEGEAAAASARQTAAEERSDIGMASMLARGAHADKLGAP